MLPMPRFSRARRARLSARHALQHGAQFADGEGLLQEAGESFAGEAQHGFLRVEAALSSPGGRIWRFAQGDMARGATPSTLICPRETGTL